MSKQYDSMSAHEMVGSIAKDPETAAYLFIAESDRGELFSQPAVDDPSGSKEIQLLAEYITVLSERTGQTRKSILHQVVEDLNSIKPSNLDND